MPYGNNNSAARGFNTIVAVSWKFIIVCILGPGVLYLDIAAGTSYFTEAFKPYVTGSFDIDIPFVGYIGWSHAVMLGFLLSAITSGIQIVLWNFSKVGLPRDDAGKRQKPKIQHLAALGAALVVFALDFMSDLGGATMWVSDTTNGALWPTNANMFQMITIPVIVIAGVCNEAILEYFFGIDKPMSGSGKLRVLRGGRANKAA